MTQQLRALLFDIDGTLADTDYIHLKVWADLLRPQGISVDKVYYTSRLSGGANVYLAKEYWPELSDDERHQIMANKEAQFRALAADLLKPLPGLLQLIEFGLANDLHIGLVTNAPRENAEFIVEKLRLHGMYSLLIIAGELARSKPDPLPYLTAMQSFGVKPSECIVLEDSVNGVRAGAASGALTIGVLTSHAAQTLTDAGAKYAITDFTHINLDSSLLQMKHFVKGQQ